MAALRWAVLALTCAACMAPIEVPERADLLTDLVDDGSLVRGLDDPDPVVRRVAALGLARLPAPAQAAAVVGRAEGESDPQTLAHLCFAFDRWQLPEAGPLLERLLGHPDPEVRAAALLALGSLGQDGRTDRLTDALDDPRPAVRGAAALGLFRLDGRRFDHPRSATEETLDRRDGALAAHLLDDPDRTVRWRCAYALGSVRPRRSQAEPLRQALRQETTEPLVLVFALRGLGALDDADLTSSLEDARRLLDHHDDRVVTEAARQFGRVAPFLELAALAIQHPSAHARRLIWQALPAAWERASATARDQGEALLLERLPTEREPALRREALVALVRMTAQDAPDAQASRKALDRLGRSEDRRDREQAATLLAEGLLRHDELLTLLLDDPEPSVRAALMPALGRPRHAALLPRLQLALADPDPAVRGQAATAAAQLVQSGRAPPRLVEAMAETLHAEQDFLFDDSQIALAEAFALPPLDPAPPTTRPEGPLLDRLVARHRQALADPHPRVALDTDRGTLVLRLDRVLAPVHVASFLSLAEAGFYDGLDVHRVVPNFVAQGLDPRGDGWGTGGRRLPDEFGPRPFLSGTLGMPHSGRPHTGGCQIFLTHLPTPHLDGAYTVFGQLEDGGDVLQSLQIGDVVRSVRRLPDA